MDEGSRLLLAVVILLLFAAMYFAVSETAFASVPRARIKARVERGDKRAKKALRVLDDFERAISTILIGTNIVHLVSASLVTLVVTRTWGLSAVTLGTIVTTVVVFFFGEMLPKSIAKKYSERIALATAGSLCFFMSVFGPLASFFAMIGKKAAAFSKGEPEVSVTEDELYDIIEDMTDEGSLSSEHGDLISSALQFAELTADTVLTARVDVKAIDVDWDCEKTVSFIREQRHSRLPVYEGSIDNVIGVLQIRKYLKAYLRDGSADLRTLLDEAYFVHRSMYIDEILAIMSTQKLNMVVVTDSFGGTLGIVTVEDILEELVGEIWDEDDEVNESFIPLGGGRFEVDAALTVSEAFDKAGFEPEKDDDKLEHKLMGEWVYETFERIPKEGESFQYEAITVSVAEMRQNRVVKLLLAVPVGETPEGGEAS